MRVDERYIRWAIAGLFGLAGLWAMLLRGQAWPFVMEDLRLPTHQALIDESRLEAALEEEVLNYNLVIDLARDIVAKEPLAVYPFEGLLSVEVERDRLVPGSMDSAAADSFAAATLDRDGRNLTARFYLLDRAIIAGDWTAALDQFGAAYELWPEQREELLFGLDQTILEPGMIDALVKASERGEAWVPFFLRVLSIDALEPAQVENVFRAQPDHHEMLLEKLARAGQFDQAFRTWQNLRPDEAAPHPDGLIDLSFVGSRALRPFNWQLDTGFAEIHPRQQALQISYRGRGRPVFASQITHLAAGSYLFRANLDALPSDDVGDFVWVMNCLTHDALPLEISIFDPTMTAQDADIPFEIPEGCAYQELSFHGFPGQFTRQISFQVNDIVIAPMEAQP